MNKLSRILTMLMGAGIALFGIKAVATKRLIATSSELKQGWSMQDEAAIVTGCVLIALGLYIAYVGFSTKD